MSNVSQRQMPLPQRPARFAQPVRLRALRRPVVVRLSSKFVAGCPRFAGQRTSGVDRPNQCPRSAAPRPCLPRNSVSPSAKQVVAGRTSPSWRAVRALPASGRPVLIDRIKNPRLAASAFSLCTHQGCGVFVEPRARGAFQGLLPSPPSRSLQSCEAHQLSSSSCLARASVSPHVRRPKVGAG